jgi:carbamate kinase
VRAAVNFVENGGARAIIADLDDASAALDGDAGTAVTAD